MKRLPVFLLGVTFGIFVTIAKFYYDVFSKPVLPKPKIVKHNLVMRYENTLPDWLEPADYLDDTQPVKVDDETGAWELEQWAKEAE